MIFDNLTIFFSDVPIIKAYITPLLDSVFSISKIIGCIISYLFIFYREYSHFLCPPHGECRVVRQSFSLQKYKLEIKNSNLSFLKYFRHRRLLSISCFLDMESKNQHSHIYPLLGSEPQSLYRIVEK